MDPSRNDSVARILVTSLIIAVVTVIAVGFAEDWFPSVPSLVVGAITAIVVGVVGLGCNILWDRLRRHRQ